MPTLHSLPSHYSALSANPPVSYELFAPTLASTPNPLCSTSHPSSHFHRVLPPSRPRATYYRRPLTPSQRAHRQTSSLIIHHTHNDTNSDGDGDGESDLDLDLEALAMSGATHLDFLFSTLDDLSQRMIRSTSSSSGMPSTPSLSSAPSSPSSSIRWTPTSSPISLPRPYLHTDSDDEDEDLFDPHMAYVHTRKYPSPFVPRGPVPFWGNRSRKDGVLEFLAKQYDAPDRLPDEPVHPSSPRSIRSANSPSSSSSSSGSPQQIVATVSDDDSEGEARIVPIEYQADSHTDDESKSEHGSGLKKHYRRFSRNDPRRKVAKNAWKRAEGGRKAQVQAVKSTTDREAASAQQQSASSSTPAAQVISTYMAAEETPRFARSGTDALSKTTDGHHKATQRGGSPRQDRPESELTDEENVQRWKQVREERQRSGSYYTPREPPRIGILVPKGSVRLWPFGTRKPANTNAVTSRSSLKRTDSDVLLPSAMPLSREAISQSVRSLPYRPRHYRRGSTDSDRTIRLGEGYVPLDPLAMTSIATTTSTLASSPLVASSISSLNASPVEVKNDDHFPVLSEVSMSKIHPALNRFNRPISPTLPGEATTYSTRHQHQTLSAPPSRPRSPNTASQSLRGLLARSDAVEKLKKLEADDGDEAPGTTLLRLIKSAQRVENGTSHRSSTLPKPSAIRRASTPVPFPTIHAKSVPLQRSSTLPLQLRNGIDAQIDSQNGKGKVKAADCDVAMTKPKPRRGFLGLRTFFTPPSSPNDGDLLLTPGTPDEATDTAKTPDTTNQPIQSRHGKAPNIPTAASSSVLISEQPLSDQKPSVKGLGLEIAVSPRSPTKANATNFDADKVAQQLRVQSGRVCFAELEGVGEPIIEQEEGEYEDVADEDEDEDEDEDGPDEEGKQAEVKRPAQERRWTLRF